MNERAFLSALGLARSIDQASKKQRAGDSTSLEPKEATSIYKVHVAPNWPSVPIRVKPVRALLRMA